MCLAIFKPKGACIKKKYLGNGFDANEDGAGFAYCKNGAVIIQKGFFTFKEFYSAFKEVNTPKETAIIHFRMATHGGCTLENCHPFQICGGKFAVIHNGIIDIECTDKSRSDTAHFCELVLQPMLEAVALESGALRYLVEEAIGDCNKLVVLSADGSHVIFNEKQGEWCKGCWYSNSGYKHSGWSLASLGKYYAGCGGVNEHSYAVVIGKGADGVWRAEEAKYTPLSAEERAAIALEANEWNSRSWRAGEEYDAETNQWKERRKRIAEMTEREWEKECEEEAESALREAALAAEEREENEKYSG